MLDNPLADYIGMDLPELQRVSEETKEKRREVAISIVKLTDYPEWKVFEEELNRLKKEIEKPCESYMDNPSGAFYDSGQKRSIQIIQNFIKSQHTIVDQYAKGIK